MTLDAGCPYLHLKCWNYKYTSPNPQKQLMKFGSGIWDLPCRPEQLFGYEEILNRDVYPSGELGRSPAVPGRGVYRLFLGGEWLTIRAQALGTLPLFSSTGAQDHALVRITEDW